MPLDVARIAAQFLPELIPIKMPGMHPRRIRRHLELSHRDPDGVDIGARSEMEPSRPAVPALAKEASLSFHFPWTHVLADNLIRTILAQAARKHGLEPRSISFKGAVQTLTAFQPVVAMQAEHNSSHREGVYQQLLDAIATHRVADRPDRYEPRLRKRRPKHYQPYDLHRSR